MALRPAIDRPVTAVHLCAGSGVAELALRLAIPHAVTVCHVEREAYAAAHLVSRMEAGDLDTAPVWSDLATFDGRPWRGRVRVVVAGYPCQPFSHAGSRLGIDDPRHLWPHVLRIIRAIGPEYVILENVPGHLSLGFRDVCGALQGVGYRVAAGVFSAAEVGAPHQRERLYVVAHADVITDERWGIARDVPCEQGTSCEQGGESDASGDPVDDRGADVADDDGAGCCRSAEPHRAPALNEAAQRRCDVERCDSHVGNADKIGWRKRADRLLPGESWSSETGDRVWLFPPRPDDADGWRDYLAQYPGTEPALRRGVDGMAARVHRLRLTGNGWVPLVGAYAIGTLCAALNGTSADAGVYLAPDLRGAD